MIKITEKNNFVRESNIKAAYKSGFIAAGRYFSQQLKAGLTTGSRSGRVYLIRGRRHQASAPGEMPAKLTGRLAGSVGYTSTVFSVSFGTREAYGAYLESGTSRMKPRPHASAIGERCGANGLHIIMSHLHRRLS